MLEDVGIDNIVISTMVYSSKKNYAYFVGCKDHDYKTKPLCLMFSKTATYVKSYDGEIT